MQRCHVCFRACNCLHLRGPQALSEDRVCMLLRVRHRISALPQGSFTKMHMAPAPRRPLEGESLTPTLTA